VELWSAHSKTHCHLIFTATQLLCLISRCYFIKASGLNWNGSNHKSSRVYTLYNKIYIMRGQWNCELRILKPTAILFFTAAPLLCLISRCYFIKASGLNWNGSGHKSSRVYTLYNKTYIMRGQWNCGVRILKPTAILFFTATPLLCLISRCYFIKASGLNWNGSGHK